MWQKFVKFQSDSEISVKFKEVPTEIIQDSLYFPWSVGFLRLILVYLTQIDNYLGTIVSKSVTAFVQL